MATPTTFIPGEIRGVEAGDLILVNRGGVSYQIDPSNAPDTAQDDDILLVNRAGKSYKCRYADIDDALDTDLLLINRGGRSYHVTFGDLRGVIGDNVTFTLRLTSPAKAILGQGPCTGCGGVPGGIQPDFSAQYCPGVIVTVDISTRENATYNFSTIANRTFEYDPFTGKSALQQFNINNEWIAVAADGAGIGWRNWCRSCYYPQGPNPPAPAFYSGDQSTAVLGPGAGETISWGTPYSTGGATVSGGCPNNSNAGTNLRNLNEETGDKWNNIGFANATVVENTKYPVITYSRVSMTYGTEIAITCNGITKEYVDPWQPAQADQAKSDLPTSGVVGEFLTWT